MKISHYFTFSIPFLLSLLFSSPLFSQSNFQVWNSWNFENRSVGPYTDDMIAQDFKVVTNYSHNSSSISQETLNGQSTKVLKITHKANMLSVGFDLDAQLAKDFDEVYLSYDFKFSNEFCSTTGGKLPGLGGLPCVTANTYPAPNIGFLCKSLFKSGGRVCTYHYDRTTGTVPWSTDDYSYTPLYFSNGVWYNITRRVKMNTFTNGVANADGICELWIDGRLIFKETNLKLMVTESSTMKIDDVNIAHFYGGSTDDCKPIRECCGYIDNIVVYTPLDDPTFGTKNTHDPAQVLNTPNPITDRNVYYDKLITSSGTLRNSAYGTNYLPCTDEAYLIDAGAGGTVSYTLNWTIGGGDWLFFYDGNRTDSKLIRVVCGSNTASQQTIKSTGRYMFVRFSTNTDAGTTGFTGTVTLNQATTTTPTVPAAPTSLQSSAASSSGINLSWTDNSSDETGFRIERKTGTGAYTQVAQVGADVRSYSDAGLAASTSYTYHVYSYNSAGNSGYSNESTVQTQTATTTGLANLAPGKPVLQSSTNYGGVAERGNDNNTNGDFAMNSVTHTMSEQSPYWQIDLQAIYNLDHIQIWNRTNSCCMDRFVNFYVLVSDVPFTSGNLSNTLNQSGVWNKFTAAYPNPSIGIPINRTGRYVRIQFRDAGEMNLAEAQIFGSSIMTATATNAKPKIKNQKFVVQSSEIAGGSVGTIAASDDNSDQRLSYSILSGNEAGLFSLQTESGDLLLTKEPVLASDTTVYNLSVSVTDNAPQPASSTATVTVMIVSMPTGTIEHSQRDNSLEIFPNPSSGLITLKLNLPVENQSLQMTGTCEMNILDISGRLVLTRTLYISSYQMEENFDVSDLREGLYFIRIHSGTTDIKEKLVIRK
jgi:hypothetical protein